MPVVPRAQAAGSWNKTACCAANPPHIHGELACGDSYCIDNTASSDFLFRLQPGEPERFLPKGGTDGTDYQQVDLTQWPRWGLNDLVMGYGNDPPGSSGQCSQGGTYTGSTNETCGGAFNWGPTDLEVWYSAAARGPEGR